MERFSIKAGVAYVNVRISKHIKEELAWAINKRLLVISNEILFTTVMPLKNKVILI